MKNAVVENLLQAFFKANPSFDTRSKREYAKHFFELYGEVTLKQLKAQLQVTPPQETDTPLEVIELSRLLIEFLITEAESVED
jgi:hypothetical protein